MEDGDGIRLLKPSCSFLALWPDSGRVSGEIYPSLFSLELSCAGPGQKPKVSAAPGPSLFSLPILSTFFVAALCTQHTNVSFRGSGRLSTPYSLDVRDPLITFCKVPFFEGRTRNSVSCRRCHLRVKHSLGAVMCCVLSEESRAIKKICQDSVKTFTLELQHL